MVQNWKQKLYSSYVTTKQAGVDSAINAHKSSVHYNKSIINKYLKDIAKDKKIVDVGCGYGSFLLSLKEKGFTNLLGLEVSKEQVEVSKELGISNYILECDILSYLENNTSELVNVFILKDIIEHFTRNELFYIFEKLTNRLDNDGKIIIHIPNASGLFGMTIRYGDLTHELAFTPKSIRQLLYTFGFNKIEIKEDIPIVHGLFSSIRYLLWYIFTLRYRIIYLVETGSFDIVLSQNMTIIAKK